MLAGGVGTRLAEETVVKPKPMVEIGGMPILWHIMKIYSPLRSQRVRRRARISWGIHQEVLRGLLLSAKQPHEWTSALEGTSPRLWTCLTGRSTSSTQGPDHRDRGPHQTPPAVCRRNETFMLTWGDGVADVDIPELIAFHRAHGKLATVTAVRPAARFGHIEFDGDRVVEFSEKPQTEEGWINGAYFVLEPEIFDYIEGDTHAMGARADVRASPRRAADGLPPRLVLAVYGYFARQEAPRRSMGRGVAALVRLGFRVIIRVASWRKSAVLGSEQKHVLAIASGGGHWQQLMRLRPAFEKQSATCVTTNAAYSVDVPGGEVFVVTAANRNHPMKLIQTAVQKRWHEPSSGCGMTRRLP